MGSDSSESACQAWRASPSLSRDIPRTSQAIRDVIDVAFYLGRRDMSSAERFIDATKDAMRELADMPGMGSPRAHVSTRLAGLRVRPVPGFRRYLVYYLSTDEELIVLRV